jgi:hypothetical protein
MIRTKLPPHINGFIDRYGHARFYVRRPGHKNVSLPGLPWSPEFMAAYAEAVDGQQPIKIGEKRSPLPSPIWPPRRSAPAATFWSGSARSMATSALLRSRNGMCRPW